MQSVNPTETNNLIKVRTLGGSRDYNNIIPGKFEVSGSFEYYLQKANFLRMAFGEDTATSYTTIDSGPKYHTGAASYLHIMGSAASPLANSFPSFTLEFTDDEDGGAPGTYNLKRKYTGCRVNTLGISGTIDNPVSVSVDWMAQNIIVSTGAATSVTEHSVDPYVFYQGFVYATSGAVARTTTQAALDANSLCQLNSFDFSLNNNLEAVWYMCGTTNVYQSVRGPKLVIPKARDYEASVSMHFNDITQYRRFLGAVTATGPQTTLTEYDIVIDLVRSGTIGATGATKLATDDYIRLVLKDAKFGEINITGAPEDIVSQNITFGVKAATMFVADADASYKL